jgi:hypothetical protein
VSAVAGRLAVSAVEIVVTRVAPPPRHPARHAKRWMAGFLACGSLRSAAFPSRQWGRSVALGQVLTAYSCGGSRGLEPRSCDLRFVPHSLFAPLRETINLVRSRASRHLVVNGCAPGRSANSSPAGCYHVSFDTEDILRL